MVRRIQTYSMAIVNVQFINNNAARYVPLFVLAPMSENEKIWLTVNGGRYPPVECKMVLHDWQEKLGLDGRLIKLELGDQVELYVGAILSKDNFDFRIAEILSL
jgi:hypothetical protein